jgi:hypothetical protein
MPQAAFVSQPVGNYSLVAESYHKWLEQANLWSRNRQVSLVSLACEQLGKWDYSWEVFFPNKVWEQAVEIPHVNGGTFTYHWRLYVADNDLAVEIEEGDLPWGAAHEEVVQAVWASFLKTWRGK